MAAPRINMEVSLGHIIQMCVLIGGGLILYGRGDERAASTAAAVAGRFCVMRARRSGGSCCGRLRAIGHDGTIAPASFQQPAGSRVMSFWSSLFGRSGPHRIPTVSAEGLAKFIDRDVKAVITSTLAACPEFDAGDVRLLFPVALESVRRGRDLALLARAIETHNHAISTARSASICRLVHNRASSLIARKRMSDLKITDARWRYANAPCSPGDDAAHQALDGTVFKAQQGVLVNGQPTWPGYAEGCKCFMRSIIPGFS